MALSVPLSRFTSPVGGGSAFFVRPHSRYEVFIQDFVVADSADIFQSVLRSRRWFDFAGCAIFRIFRPRSVSFDVSVAWRG